ncbi:MAG: CoA-binding protein [Pseudomonadota bacterium]
MSQTSYSDAHLRAVLTETKTIAAVGVSPTETRPSYFVARYLSLKGFTVIPVNPVAAGRRLFGQEVQPSLAAIPEAAGRIDMLDIFRRSEEVGPIVEEALTHLVPRGLRTVWMQIGVINPEAAARAEAAGLTVIMNRCPKIEYQRLFGELRMGGFNTGILSSKLP